MFIVAASVKIGKPSYYEFNSLRLAGGRRAKPGPHFLFQGTAASGVKGRPERQPKEDVKQTG